MFFLGAFIGMAITALVAVALIRQQRARLESYERDRSAYFRRLTELERETAEAKANSAAVIRAANQRSEREFAQYKILLRRADKALAQARSERRSSSMHDAA